MPSIRLIQIRRVDGRGNVAEIWVFSRTTAGSRYLVLEASQEKADAFFGGYRFWQIPGTSMLDDGETTVDCSGPCPVEWCNSTSRA